MRSTGEQGIAAPDALTALFCDEALLSVFSALQLEGEETRIVGGALRDALFGRPPHEIDLATTLFPEAVITRTKAAGLRAIPTGIQHGTVTVLAGQETFEVTTLREDIETDGRHAEVRFGRDFRIDALRRDFTMNALSLAPGGRLFDYTGGLADIVARKVRFIGEPEQRIKEDYLRILRFFRFSADFGEGLLDRAGRLAAIRQREGLGQLSRERIRAELLKLFCARKAVEVCSEICGDGLLHPLLASAPNPARLRRLIAIGEGAGPAENPLLRLAALCLALPEDALRLRDRLRLSNTEAERLEAAARALIGLHGRDEPPGFHDLQALLFRHGRQAAVDAVLLAEADARPGNGGGWVLARNFLFEATEPRLPFSGADVIALGITEGRAIGEALRGLQARWIEAGFPTDPASLTRLLDEVPRRAG
ncbi:CCA tRNA nucleotidyltransferase [Methylocapsa sp. D3K7]|uniref:CCA tRNA nucleotidyltransferase n=1 Tax=Methylocapsa sp. D3K7 TaxID=3041435 RepID=UPI00244EA129|nr:CCA tRNA nucleotidyltransferase [Methylocapsa sp. D3K7]WGJ14681.1 CCA tRNA nucleotidyltransferase [Methylocapsa sp. D3K7]